MTRKEILNLIKENNIRHIKLEFLDSNDNLKSVTVPVASVDAVLNNSIMYTGLSTNGYNKISETEICLVPKLDTYKELEFKDSKLFKTASIMCDTKLESGDVTTSKIDVDMNTVKSNVSYDGMSDNTLNGEDNE